MNEDMPERQTIVVGGSYPGALSAWFRYTYPNIATASWAASAVVQPMEDMWTYDEQVYISTKNIGVWCSDILQRLGNYAAEQGLLRDAGQPNAVDDIIVGTDAEGMPTADFMAYVGDFPAGEVQYGGSESFCNQIKPLEDSSAADIFTTMINAEIAAGNTPIEYDTRPDSKIMSTVIDVDYSGRTWTYQYCTEFGWFQTASKVNRVRPFQVNDKYWIDQCQLIFPSIDMSQNPNMQQTLNAYGNGNQMDGTNIFFTNGSEDPWKWVTQLENRPEINQLSRVSDCTGCAHCADLYTPAASDP